MISSTRPERGAPAAGTLPASEGLEVRLASRPVGMPTAANFELVNVPRPVPGDGQVLVHNLFLSVDPYMRGRMSDRPSYVPAFELHAPLGGGAIGEVVWSRSDAFQPGDIVTSNLGWREFALATAGDLRTADRRLQPLSLHLGAFGMTGLTAWAGLQLAEARAGETFFVSGAAGAVGSVAGQLAKVRGCRVIGSAGSAEKVRFLREDCGFDAAFDHRDGAFLEHLRREAPDGIDVYFDNVGGEALEAALGSMRLHGRIVMCGGISGYNAEAPRPGPNNLFNVTTRRLTLRGLIVGDWLGRRGEFEAVMRGCLRNGTVNGRETVVDGIEHMVDAFLGLFEGRNTGKMIVRTA